ncbi:hypothetical protein HY413_03455 [Candidatus Kaiserbacteria bacterium]|nr:hypothetical protein [Candidatus Kaiserbacteria bacterium]
MFERQREHPGPEYNEIMAVKLRREAEAKEKLVAQETWPEPPADPLEKLRERIPELFEQGKKVERAIAQSRNDIRTPEEEFVNMVFRVLGL